MVEAKNSVAERKTNVFEISRTFNAPRALVWKVFSEGEHLAKWWGPKGFVTTTLRFDFRPGGVFHYVMSSGNGNTMWGRFIYREIHPITDCTFVVSFSDPEGNITRAPFSDVWPLEVLNVMTLVEADGKTTLTLRGSPINAAPEEQAMYDSMHASMRAGFTGSWDQLEKYLEQLQAAGTTSA